MENVSAAADPTLDFTVGITNAGTGSIMYYDHWEDGYEVGHRQPGAGDDRDLGRREHGER